jgi:integrase
MAHLIKREGSPYWIAAFDVTMPDGTVRRLKKSTKKKKRDQAMGEALRLESLAKKEHTADQGTASKAYAILAEAADAAARGELSEARARNFIARMAEVSTGEKLQFYTVAGWRDEWLVMKGATSKPATIARYKAHVDSFIEWIGEKADAKLEAVTKADFRGFRDAIRAGWMPEEKQSATNPKRKPRKADKKPQTLRTAKTVNHYAADVAAMFRHAMRDGLILSNPAAALARLPEIDSTEREVFTVAEVGKLVEAAGKPAWQDTVFLATKEEHDIRAARCADWQGMILLGFYAGARLGDCARLTWAAINFTRKTLSFMPAKTERKRKRLEVPLHPRLVSWLEGREGSGDGAASLFPALHSAAIGGRHGLSSQFIAIMDLAEVDRRTTRAGTKGTQRAQHARSFHALRHSLTSTLANLDVSEEIRRRIVGHDSAEVHSGYTHHERETLARAVEKMPSV